MPGAGTNYERKNYRKYYIKLHKIPSNLRINVRKRVPINWESQAKDLLRGKKQKMARIVGANYTDEASLKHTYTLITVDSDEIGGVRVYRSESE